MSGSFTNHWDTYQSDYWPLYAPNQYVDIECWVYNISSQLIHHDLVEDIFANPYQYGGIEQNFSFPNKGLLDNGSISSLETQEPTSLGGETWGAIKSSF